MPVRDIVGAYLRFQARLLHKSVSNPPDANEPPTSETACPLLAESFLEADHPPDPIRSQTDAVLEEPQSDQIANALEVLSGLPTSFSLQEAALWLDSGVALDALDQALTADKRFLVLSGDPRGLRLFVPEATLFRCFANLTIRLAQAGEARMTENQLALRISSLRTGGGWESCPPEAAEFAKRYTFVAPASVQGEVVFPLAYLLFDRAGLTVSSILKSLVVKERRKSILAKSVSDRVDELLSHFNPRTVLIIKRREGIFGDTPATLEEIGQDLGLTRERVRQVEAKFWKACSHPKHLRIIMLGLLGEIIRRQGSLILRTDERLLIFLAKCASVRSAEVPGTGLALLGISSSFVTFLESLAKRAGPTDADIMATMIDSKPALRLSASDLRLLSERLAVVHQKRATKAEKVYVALRSIGKPAHYSIVAREYNRLFPDDESTEHSIHAILGREQYGVVWIGVRGTFALKEWGYERPSEGLYEAVAEIVRKKYEETGRPVSFTVIAGEIGRYRQIVNPSSLFFAAHFNPELERVSKDHFIPKNPSESSGEGIPDDELDAILREFEEKQ